MVLLSGGNHSLRSVTLRAFIKGVKGEMNEEREALEERREVFLCGLKARLRICLFTG